MQRVENRHSLQMNDTKYIFKMPVSCREKLKTPWSCEYDLCKGVSEFAKTAPFLLPLPPANKGRRTTPI